MTSRRPVPAARHFAIATAAFLVFVVYGSFVPFRVQPVSLDAAWEQYAHAMSSHLTWDSRADWAANVLLFAPLAFLAAGALTVDRHRWPALGLIPILALLSAAIEFAQVWFPDRYVSLNDVVAETLGGVVGVLAWVVLGQAITDRVRSWWARLGPGWRAAKLLPFYLVFLTIVHGMPFDLTLSPWQLLRKYKRGREPDAAAHGAPRIALAPTAAEWPGRTALNLVAFAPVGALLARVPGWGRHGFRFAFRVLGIGLVVALAIECLQLIVLSRDAIASDVPCSALFVVAGWLLGKCLPGADPEVGA